jgi:nucleotide-binding universal stress UspA family protein
MAPIIILLGLGIVGLGVGWYFVYVRDHAIDRGLIDEAIAPPTDAYRVLVPVSNPDTQQDIIRLAAATAHAHTDEGRPELVAVNVLRVADPDPQQNVAAERLDHQRDLLEGAHDIASEMDVQLRTVAMAGERVDETILEAIFNEEPDQALLGWQGTLTRQGHVFGPNLDAIVEDAPCEITLVTFHDDTIGTPVALAGPGPHSPIAARRAAEFASIDGAVPTLLNVQQPMRDGDSAASERGNAIIDDVAEQAGLNPEEYEREVVVDDDIEAAILGAADQFDTICVGLSERSTASQIMFGTIAERISQEATGNVGIVRGSNGP